MTVVAAATVPGEPVTVLSNGIIHFGFGGNDAITLSGSISVIASTSPPTIVSSNMAITGGTGNFLGATGDAVLSSDPGSAKLNIYVPGLPTQN
jgi:hypothetical protein